ncbi:hypothetical protein LguiA_033810 [Lonicera macranthoides]
MDHGCTSLLSLYCQEREVFVALSSQPCALPSTLGGPVNQCVRTSHLAQLSTWSGQASNCNLMDQPGQVEFTIQPLQSPHLSHKLTLPSPAKILSPTEYLKYQKLHLIGQCGNKYICRRVIDSLCKERATIAFIDNKIKGSKIISMTLPFTNPNERNSQFDINIRALINVDLHSQDTQRGDIILIILHMWAWLQCISDSRGWIWSAKGDN